MYDEVGILGSVTEWSGVTTLHPIGLIALILCVIMALMLSRRRAIIPLLILIVAIPSAQRIVILSIDFSFIRILILVFIVRIISQYEHKGLKLAHSDIYLLGYAFWGVLAYGVLLDQFGGFITRIGYMVDAVGAYFIGRVYLRSYKDIKQITLFLGMIAIPILIIFIIERVTGTNMFSVFGGVPEFTQIRDGRLRCQGPFSHPILAGIFWAGLLPWLWALWNDARIEKWKIIFSVGCIVLIIFNTASSTPVMATLFSIVGISLFYIRHIMPLLRWGLLILLIGLQIIMDAPVWHLISRIDLAGGSTGWHRYNLIQQAINHVDEWWLVGTTSTAHWGWGLQDVTNQYILEAVRGGLLEMIFFMLFLASVFVLIGKGIKKSSSRAELWVLWASGVMLFVHSMNFLAVSYFGQIVSAFFLLIGATVSVADKTTRSQRSSPTPQIDLIRD